MLGRLSMPAGLVGCIAAALLGACAERTIHLRISGLSRVEGHEVGAASFVLRPADPAVREDDLLFEEFSALVASALEEIGYEPATDAQGASVAIYVSYGVSGPIVREYQEAYPTSQLPRTHIYPGNDPDLGAAHRHLYYYDYTVRTRYETRFESFLDLVTISLEDREGDEGAQLWTLSVATRTRSVDLRRLIPFLIAGSIDYWGVDTAETIRVNIERKDPKVERLRAGEPGWSRDEESS